MFDGTMTNEKSMEEARKFHVNTRDVMGAGPGFSVFSCYNF